MLCAKLSTRRDGFQFPCGQCTNCKINKRRDWQSRLLLEAATHEYGIFVTLTFAPIEGPPHVLRKIDLVNFHKRLSEIIPYFRHFSCGEYGTQTGRAHFHTHLFSNIPILQTDIRKAWPFGLVHVGDTEPASLDYVLGYMLKDKKIIVWPVEKQFPEFRYYSKGMGKHALPHLLIDGTELPREFQVFSRKWPVGRYLRDRAKKMGFTISERECVTLERLEATALRSLLPDGKFTTEEYEAAKIIVTEKRKQRSEELKKRAIRAAYLLSHGHVSKKGNKNETF